MSTVKSPAPLTEAAAYPLRSSRRIKESLDASGVTYVELGGVVPNPRLSLVREGIELCRKEGVDFLLAVGGGSVIDSAKAIGYGVYNGGDVWDFYDFKRQAEGCLPIGRSAYHCCCRK